MDPPGAIRLFRFRPLRLAFDAVVRDELVPDLARQPGVVAVHAGRQGPGDLGPRLVVSVWNSRSTMEATMGEDIETPAFHPEYQREIAERDVIWLALRFARLATSEAPIGLLRLVTGTLRPGHLDDYAHAVITGTELDTDAGHGPLAIYLATRAPDEFLTLSAWRDWDTLQQATGSGTRQPMATRHAELLLDWSVAHYEAIPNVVAAAPESPG
ncbi:MAG: hypothetical protein HYX57_00535 [Chloroflexi bacterium]|nr:hypothetical protein [Chloroflexota bacterium]